MKVVTTSIEIGAPYRRELNLGVQFSKQGSIQIHASVYQNLFIFTIFENQKYCKMHYSALGGRGVVGSAVMR